MLLEVLSLEIYPNVSVTVTNSFPSVPHVETDRQRSITVPLYQQWPPVRTDVPRTLPPLRTSSLEHLPSQAHDIQNLGL